MFIPVGTDAPIYHFPFATIGIAVANVLVHVGLGAVAPDGEFALSPLKQDWSLWFGEGVHPLQWVTSCFLHGGWLHLVGNLIFLWGFGIIVEGKLGWWRFTLFYLAIGAIGCGIEQLALLPADFAPPGREEVERMLRDAGENEDEIDRLLEGIPLPDHFVALGASGAIFGLVAVCMVWAPKNDLDVLWILWIRGGISEIPIYAFALLYVGLEAATLAFQASVLGREYAVSSALLHVVGALVGLAGGVLLLKRGWVDCENWDLFNVWRGTHGDRSELELHRRYSAELTVPSMSAGGGDGRDGVLPRDDAPPKSARKKKRRPADPLARLRRHLAADDAISAFGELELLRVPRPGFVPPEPDCFALAECLDRAGETSDAAVVFADYLKTYGPVHESHDPAHAAVIRLRAARRLLEKPGRRGQAAGLLRGVDRSVLTPKQAATFAKLTDRAAG